MALGHARRGELAVFGIALVSVVFSWYAANFSNYNATYGSLGALIGFLTWMWLSAAVVIAGAELDSELEHQTRRDSTTGRPKPLGARGAYMADHVAVVGKGAPPDGKTTEDRQEEPGPPGRPAGGNRQPGLLLSFAGLLLLASLAQGRVQAGSRALSSLPASASSISARVSPTP